MKSPLGSNFTGNQTHQGFTASVQQQNQNLSSTNVQAAPNQSQTLYSAMAPPQRAEENDQS
jgi:hypothetical protein